MLLPAFGADVEEVSTDTRLTSSFADLRYTVGQK
jgi:hypothetical protein